MNTMVQMAGSLMSDFLIWRYDQIQTFCTVRTKSNDLTMIDNGQTKTNSKNETCLNKICKGPARLKVAFLQPSYLSWSSLEINNGVLDMSIKQIKQD